MRIITDATTPETAYIINDYPYGFTLRCKIRYWLEYKPGRGVRFMSQTTNPKKGDVWNTTKASTYARIAGCMFVNDDGHVQWSALNEYTNATEARAWRDLYGEGVPTSAKAVLDQWISLKERHG